MNPNAPAGPPSGRLAWKTTLIVAAVLAATAAPQTARADGLAQRMVQVAPEVVKYLQGEKCRNVGVLKFLIKKGDNGRLSHSVGTLNSTLADRVETALVMALDAKVEDPLGIIDDASAVAKSLGNPNYLTEEGRKTLFGHKGYPLRWGDRKVAPDAFVTGYAELPSGQSMMNLTLCVLNAKGQRKYFGPFEVDLNTNLMTEIARDFLILRNFGDGTMDLTTQVARKESVTQQSAKVPVLKAKSAPVTLEVYYDGKLVEYDLGPDGTAQIAEPREGQEVSFRLKKNDNRPVTYGVVLKANGQNTLFYEQKPALQCRKWLLDEEQKVTDIKGFQVDPKHFKPFRVGSLGESRDRQSQYGTDVGQISLVVFQGQKKGDPPPEDLPPDEDPGSRQESPDRDKLAAVTFGKSPKKPDAKPKNLLEAQFEVNDTVQSVAAQPLKELIFDTRETAPGQITQEPFNPNPVPVMSATIVYYKPR